MLLEKLTNIKKTPVYYGRVKDSICINAEQMSDYKLIALGGLLGSSTINQRSSFLKEVDVFHALDHLIPRLNNIPVVATIHDVIPISNPEWMPSKLRWIKKSIWKRAINWCDKIVTISEFSSQEISRVLNIDPKKISVIPLGVSEIFFNKVDEYDSESIIKKYNLPHNYFIFIGLFQPRKNLMRLIEAHEMLPIKIRTNYPLVIVGQVGWGVDDVILRLKSYSDNKFVRWIERVDEKEKLALLQNATALVFPSLYEGFGLPVLEAFASRLPVITSNCSAIPEVAGNAALLIDPKSVIEIADAMMGVVSGDDNLASMIDLGYSRALDFTWDNTAKETCKVYNKIVS
jgi:alpha-1,3-rhamnosyl/mannosyltransferase